MSTFYVYEHWRPDADVCFYVGKGKGRRAYKFHDRNSVYNHIAETLARIGMCVEVRMVASDLTESEAFTLERERIEFWRSSGIELANRTDGGDGFSGFIRPTGIRLSKAAKMKLSEARRGMKFSAEHRAKLADKKKGVKRKPFTVFTRARMRSAATLREQAKREKSDKVTRTSRIKDPESTT